MKRLLLTLLAIPLFCTLMNAQTLRIGPKLGLNLANYTGNVNSDVRGLAGLHAGGFFEIQLLDILSVQPELFYSVQGVTIDDTKLVNNYISLPIMGKFYPIEGLHIEAGPQLGFLISASEKNRADKVTITQEYKTVDMGLSFGAGYRIPDLDLGFGIRYFAGLSNIFQSNSRIKNGVFQLYTFWAFEL